NGVVGKVEKDYEKAIPIIEHLLDLDVTEWNYQRGRVNIILSKNAVEADYFYRSSVPEDYLTIGLDQTQGEVKWHYNKFPHMLLVGGTAS
ncbi:hypothetical protein, partial [Terribacillus saccharophilus]|uniref:hypothetical protein n=1 Tax=Terribacillus saccharophilus TaxID=361277 RepID=UPI000BCC2EA4